MTNTEIALKKFRETPDLVVIFTPDEYASFCSYYGAVKPNDYDSPFMGHVIEVREPEYSLPEIPAEEGEYEAPLSNTFLETPEVEEGILPPPVEQFSDELVEQEEVNEDVINEDPYA